VFIRFSEALKKRLRKPLGKFATVKSLPKGRKIIAVGDRTTLNLLKAGIIPQLAVCDSIIKRKKITAAEKKRIRSAFKKIIRLRNPRGTLSEQLLKNAASYMKKGGLILIDGEEDLTALAFALAGTKKYLILYGQPNEGLIAVEPENKKIKQKIKKILSAASLAHEI
jgi:hypothetical protein